MAPAGRAGGGGPDRRRAGGQPAIGGTAEVHRRREGALGQGGAAGRIGRHAGAPRRARSALGFAGLGTRRADAPTRFRTGGSHGWLRARSRRSPSAALVALSSPARADDYPSRPITLILPLGRRRRDGHPGARAVRAEARRAARQAGRHREPHRRRHGDRGDRGREGRRPTATRCSSCRPARSTTNATLYKKLPYDPAKDFAPIALTSSRGLRAGRSIRRLPVQVDAGAGATTSRSGPASCRTARPASGYAASRRRDVQARRRPEDDARALSRHAAGDQRRGRRPSADGVRRSAVRAAADRGRQAAPARGVVARERIGRGAGRADARRARLPGFRSGVAGT